MFEFFLILTVSIIFTFTIFAFIFGMFCAIVSYSEYGIKTTIAIILACFLLITVNFNFVGVENQDKFIKTYTKEEINKMMEKVVMNGEKHLAGDNILFKIDDLNYYKLLCDNYFLNVYEDNKIIKIYFYEYVEKRGRFSEVACSEQKILKENK